MQCEKCKAELTDGQNFCPSCGAAAVKNVNEENENLSVPCKEQSTVVCEVCGTESAPNAAFCAVCGNRLAKKENSRSDSGGDSSYKSLTSKSKSGLSVREIVKKSIVALVSLAILVFAFLPVVSFQCNLDGFNTADLDIDKIDIKFSAFDCIGMCFDAMKSLDKEELLESDYYYEIESIAEDLLDDLDKDEQKEACSKLALYTIKLFLSSENAKFRVVYVFSLVLAIALILFVLAAFALSFTDLVLFVLKKDIPVLIKTVKNILAVLPAFMILLFAAVKYSYPTEYSGLPVTSSLTATGVLIIVLSVCALAYLAMDRIFFSGKIKVNVKEIVYRSLSSVFACVLLFTMFMPIISFNAKTIFGGKTKLESVSIGFNHSYFGSFDMTEEELDKYRDMTESYADFEIKRNFQLLGGYSKKEFSRGESNSENDAIMNIAFLGYGGTDMAWIVAMLPVVSLLIGAVAVILLWQNIMAVVDGSSPRSSLTVTVRIIAIILTVVALVLVTLFTVISNYNLDLIKFGKGHDASVSLNAGTIVALIFSIASLCVPMGKRNKEKHIEEC